MSEKVLTNQISALLTYANGVTGAEDTKLGDAVRTLADGFGGGDDGMELKNVITPEADGELWIALPTDANSKAFKILWFRPDTHSNNTISIFNSSKTKDYYANVASSMKMISLRAEMLTDSIAEIEILSFAQIRDPRSWDRAALSWTASGGNISKTQINFGSPFGQNGLDGLNIKIHEAMTTDTILVFA